MEDIWFVYVIECRDNKFYIGIAKDVEKRVGLHSKGLACRFTKYRWPVKLLYTEKYFSKSTARKREIELKGFSKKKKVKIVLGSSAVPASESNLLRKFGPIV